MVYFIPSRLSFIPAGWKTDGTYSEDAWPTDAILLDEETADKYWKQSPPKGKQLGTLNGQPAWVAIPAPPPLTRAEVEVLRLRAYADPLTGSDRKFSEASRMQLMGESGSEAVRAAAIDRYAEIQAANPWPVVGLPVN